MHSVLHFMLVIGACLSAAASNLAPRLVTGTTSAGTSTILHDPNYLSCSKAFSTIDSCAAETTGFTTLDDGDQASCLCYSSSTWLPNVFDAYQSACVQWAATADKTALSAFEAAAGLCTRVGNVASATVAVTTAPPRPSSTGPSAVQTTSIPVATTTLPTTSATTSAAPAGNGAGPRRIEQVCLKMCPSI